MSLWGAFSISTQAMMAQTSALNAISQNVANLNTAGYKKLDPSFKTLLGESEGPRKFYTVKEHNNHIVDKNGQIRDTGGPYDIAINGRGMLVLNTKTDGTGEQLYTRNGSFAEKTYNLSGTTMRTILVGGNDLPVMAWKAAANGTFPTTGALSEVVTRPDSLAIVGPTGERTSAVPQDEVAGRPTAAASIAGNVDARATDNQAQTIPVVNNAFATKTLALAWTPRTAANSWNLDFIVSNGTVTSPAPGANTVTFGSDAVLSSASTIPISVTWADGTTGSITLDISGMTQYASQTQIRTATQDGLETGFFDSSSFTAEGVLNYNYTNGMVKPMYKLPVAMFPAVNSLEDRQGTLFAQTDTSGAPTLTAMGAKGSSTFVVGAFETSNVDIGQEFTQMLLTQKAYSSSAQVFKTTDEMTQLAGGLIRG